MPRAPKACVVSKCPRQAVLGGRCPKHQITERYVEAWAGSQHASTSTAQHRVWRKQVIQRDDGICQMCGAPNSNQADHIVPLAEGGTWDVSNGQCLCDPCHRRKSAQEGVRGRERARARRTSGDRPQSR